MEKLTPGISYNNSELSQMLKRVPSSPLVWTMAFVLLILALNLDLFRKPYIEITDYAANSLLVQQARHCKLLTGHYSRWHFHHPGPAYLYLFAFGEFVFHDFLHLAPAPYNAQVIITIVLNVALLLAALAIIRRHAGDGFPTLPALAVTTVVAVLVNRGTQPSMLISNWMPDVLLFSFLLFLVSAASVLAGASRDLPWMALSGMLLIHAHVAQLLFVGVIGGGGVAWVLVRAARAGRLGIFVRENRRYFACALAICALFFLPVALELMLDRPNNLDDIQAYLRRTAGFRNTFRASAGYLFCFAAFIPDPDVLLPSCSAKVLFAYVLSQPATVVYWTVLVLICLVTVLLSRKKNQAKARDAFVIYLGVTGAAAAALFLYWGIRIFGGMFAFNGRFISALHLLGWLALLAKISLYLTPRQNGSLAIGAAVFTLLFALSERDNLRPQPIATTEAFETAKDAPAGPGRLQILFKSEDWPWAVGVANQMERMGKAWCVDPDWGFLFSRAHVCPDHLDATRLLITRTPVRCVLPCRAIFRGADFSAMTLPAASTLPIEIGFADPPSAVWTGFNPNEGSFRSTSRNAAIRFRVALGLPVRECFKLLLKGFAFPGQSVQISLNGAPLGTWNQTQLSLGTITVPRGLIRPVENVLSFESSGEPGFGFISFTLREPDPGEYCATSATPVYTSVLPPAALPRADFNGAGRSDLVWQYPDGHVRIWFLGGPQGTTRLGIGQLVKTSSWRIAGVADFNGDGHPDLIWQDPVSGRSEVWFQGGSDGTTTLSTADLAGATAWRIAAAADFNHDGHPDLVWQDPATGSARIEYLAGPRGITHVGTAELTPKNAWRIAGAGDFNGDGQPDLLWQDPARGILQIWHLGGATGTSIMGSVNLTGPVDNFRVVAVADFNMDGHPDLVLQDPRSGASLVWFMSGEDERPLLGTMVLTSGETGRIAGPR